MRVIATALGFDGRDLRQAGEEFDMPEGAKGSWFDPVEPADPKPAAPAAKTAKARGDSTDLA